MEEWERNEQGPMEDESEKSRTRKKHMCKEWEAHAPGNA